MSEYLIVSDSLPVCILLSNSCIVSCFQHMHTQNWGLLFFIQSLTRFPVLFTNVFAHPSFLYITLYYRVDWFSLSSTKKKPFDFPTLSFIYIYVYIYTHIHKERAFFLPPSELCRFFAVLASTHASCCWLGIP